MGIIYFKWGKGMIDTIKIYTMINKTIYDKISNNSIVKTSYNSGTGEIYYKIVNDRLEGSYDSSLSVRVGEGAKYRFVNNYFIEIEGSYHKICNGYNSHNGFYNIVDISLNLVKMVEYAYNIVLPSIKHWFLQRVDIACCYDLLENSNVVNYINNLSLCSYPRRNIKHYQDESIYSTGSTTTLKIYNKMLEFKKHDMKKFVNTSFDLVNYLSNIKGFIRFECEIKKKKLESLYNKKYVRILNVNYKELKEVWKCEFMKLLNFFENDLSIVRSKEDIERRLFSCYSSVKARNLYNFYLSLILDGYRIVKKRTSKSTFYRNIKDLKDVNIDINQKYKLDLERKIVDFDPFTYKEVV